MFITILFSFVYLKNILMLLSVEIGGILDLSEAIRDHHGLTGFPQMVSLIHMQFSWYEIR